MGNLAKASVGTLDGSLVPAALSDLPPTADDASCPTRCPVSCPRRRPAERHVFATDFRVARAPGGQEPSHGDGLDLDAVRIGNRQAFLGEALEVEGDSLTDGLLRFLTGSGGDDQAREGRNVRAP